MIFVLIIISLAAFVLSLSICCSEIYHERDWPRDTAWYPLIFGFTSLILICAV